MAEEIEGVEELAVLDGEGEEPTADELAELAAVEEAETAVGIAVSLAEARTALEAQRVLTAEAVARYRAAVLAAEPELPPDLVAGETVAAVDAAIEAARRTVAEIRARIASEATSARGFPAGAPARGDASADGLSAAEKIAWGLRERGR